MADDRTPAQQRLDALRNEKPNDADGYIALARKVSDGLKDRQEELATDNNRPK